MDGERKITSWSDLQLTDLVYAFRKAKADCFFDRTLAIASDFAGYEIALTTSLSRLLGELQAGRIAEVLGRNDGDYRLVPKKLSRRPKGEQSHVFFSAPARAFEHLLCSEEVVPEFRLVGVFPVEVHILSALWINLVGHKFDAKLSDSAFGSRLRRLRRGRADDSEPGHYHIHAPGSFEPYFTPYKKWRDLGLKTLRAGLERGDALVAVSLDFKSYYHSIDPTFFVQDAFLEQIGLRLSSFEIEFSRAIAKYLAAWSERARGELTIYAGQDEAHGEFSAGLPIGLAATRLIANCLLAKWDSIVQTKLTPLYYGRYVDDILMVLKDPGDLANSASLFEMLAGRLSGTISKTGDRSSDLEVDLGTAYQGASVLRLQEGKQKVFFLQGVGGLDLLESIGKEIRSVSSERRLMPDLSMLEESTAARVLSAAGSVSDEADTLRRADSLSVRRLGWSLQLRNAETVAHDLPAEEWAGERGKFYEFAKNHILRADRILDHADYLPRLLSPAVALEDWTQAADLLRSALNSIEKLSEAAEAGRIRSARVNGQDRSADNVFLWTSAQRAIVELAADAVFRAYRWREQRPVLMSPTARRLLAELGFHGDDDDLALHVRRLRNTDWAKVAYKDHIRLHADSVRKKEGDEDDVVGTYHKLGDLREFLDVATAGDRRRLKFGIPHAGESLFPYVFPTRPYTAREIALFAPECITGSESESGSQIWERYVRAVRGVWVRSSTDAASGAAHVPADDYWVIGTGNVRPVRLGITSFLTSNATCAACADGKPDLSPSRYRSVVRLINQCLGLSPRPTHVLMPEVSLPERWVETASSRLRDAGISLIAGVDYVCQSNEVYSEAVLVLADDRLGYPSTVEIRQRKGLPAPGEEEELHTRFGKSWASAPSPKPVYWHSGFAFGVLVCSELQSIRYRQSFQGRVDALFTLSWNRDLETFSALIESAALDVHAFVALVNNRMYGDSRVRAPMKAAHERDLCRVRGGGDDYVVVVDIDIDELRAFQSRAKNWPRKQDRFKPVPEGFELSRLRKSRPSR